MIFHSLRNAWWYYNIIICVFKNNRKIISSVDVSIIGQTTLKHSYIFMLISFSLCS